MTRSSGWKPERFCDSKPSRPVTMSGCWYSSPTLRQNSGSWSRRSTSSLYWSRSALFSFPDSDSRPSILSIASCRGGRSGSITCSRAELRSWFCRRREVSEDRSTSASTRSVAKPAIRTRRKPETSSFDCSGVSTGTSTNEAQPAPRSPRRSAALRALLALAIALVIGFPEQVVVLLDVDVVGPELHRALVGRSRLVELTLLLVGDGEVVEGGNVVGVELDRLLEPEACFQPEALLGDVDPELHFIAAAVLGGRSRNEEEPEERENHCRLLSKRESRCYFASRPESKGSATAERVGTGLEVSPRADLSLAVKRGLRPAVKACVRPEGHRCRAVRTPSSLGRTLTGRGSAIRSCRNADGSVAR